ncbi:MAG TPA: substrate-binding domain-containing protein [Vicinamibacteria bacterium]|nr:substrate-binding domain-containing protein [Vicinamibacteria bacterium]
MAHRLTLALVDSANPFQQLLRADAEAAARREGLSLETTFTGESFTAHLAVLRGLIGHPSRRPDVLIVMAVRDQGIEKVVREAAAAGVHWLLLNAIEDDLDPVRRAFPAVAISAVCPDELETGRIQGQQMLALAGPGNRVLYLQGNPRSLTSRQRAEGMRQATTGSGIEVAVAGHDWDPAQAARTVREWLRLGVSGRRPFHLVTGQNDAIAEAAREVLTTAARESGREDLGRIPVTGCDGAPDAGLKAVREGRLTATVVLPRCAGPAVEAAARLLLRGQRPSPEIALRPESFPTLRELRPTA